MLGDAVRRVMELYPQVFYACHTRHVRDPASGRELSAHQASILDHLDRVEPTSLTELARHMGVTASTMSIGIERLVRGGYVLRGSDPQDARRVLLRLSAAGARVRDAQSVLDADRVRVVLDALGRDNLDVAVRGLALLAEAARGSMASKRLYGLSRQGRAAAGARGRRRTGREVPR